MWQVTNRGFLPEVDPIHQFPIKDRCYNRNRLSCELEELSGHLPQFMEKRRVREELVCSLRNTYAGRHILDIDDLEAEYLMLLFSCFASAYVYAKHETPASRLPKEISVPLTSLAARLGRKPILSYASYCLSNWQKIDPDQPIELGNLKLLQNFSQEGKRDEDWFILVHVDIEAKAAEVVNVANEIGTIDVGELLLRLRVAMAKMNLTLNRMPEECSPDNYYRLVRPYIFSFNNVVYEGCFDDQPQTFRGETGAQSSIVPTLLAILGVKHEDSMLTQHLDEMRDYMPANHQEYLETLESRCRTSNFRLSAQEFPQYRELYNECVNELLAFRAKHFEYAVNYIMNRTSDPTGTGGTPYLPWLMQLRDETEQHLLK